MRWSKALLPCLPLAAAAFALVSGPKHATAEDATQDTQERAERCATRVSTAILGVSPAADLASAPNPQSQIDAILADPRFVERFARFVNSQFNNAPGAAPAEDASYYLAKYVLEQKKPWAELFIGKYDVAPTTPNNPMSEAAVTEDADGLGYFRSRAWAVRYAGNEPAGMRIVTAYRMMQNVVGLKLQATTNAPDADISAAGRKSAACATCHFNNWYALDEVAGVLGTRTGTGANVRFTPPAGGPKTILGGVSVSNDQELVTALVGNEAFDVNACRLSFRYLYGRAEYTCDGPVFDKCVQAFKQDKKITTALAAIAKDASFCE